MSTLKTTNIQHPSAVSPAIVLAADGTATAQVSSINGGPLAGFRNQIQNGLFQVRQRGDTFTSPSAVYTFDRWWMGNAAGRTVAFVKEGQFMSAIRITNNTADNVFLRQPIEIPKGSVGAFVQGTTWTLSLWSDSTGWVGRNLGACAFRDAGRINDANGQRGQTATPFVATGETNGVYKRYASQITIDTLPAATHEMLCIGLSLPTGDLRITGVQLEPGPVATTFEARPYGQELALCQRYYETGRLFAACYFQTSTASGTDYIGTTYCFKQTKRASPIVATTNLGDGTIAVHNADVDAVGITKTGPFSSALNIALTASAEL